MPRLICLICLICGLLATGCGQDERQDPLERSSSLHVMTTTAQDRRDLYASQVISFEPGDAAGFGAERMPEVVYGPPQGGSARAGSLDVVSLGRGGRITLGFGEFVIRDGQGPDFVVFENAFFWGEGNVFSELGTVEVSQDGQEWRRFPCEKGAGSDAQRQGCAGWRPTLPYDTSVILIDPGATGGDAFDLEDLGFKWVRYVRIADLEARGASPSAGFDLDAVGIVNLGRLN